MGKTVKIIEIYLHLIMVKTEIEMLKSHFLCLEAKNSGNTDDYFLLTFKSKNGTLFNSSLGKVRAKYGQSLDKVLVKYRKVWANSG